MWPFTFSETLTLIGVLTTSVVSVITALRTEKIHKLVNQNFTEQKNEIVRLRGQLLRALKKTP